VRSSASKRRFSRLLALIALLAIGPAGRCGTPDGSYLTIEGIPAREGPSSTVGGVGRFLESGSVTGVHRVANRAPVRDEDAFDHVVSAQVTQYLAEMGIGAQLLPIMEAVPHGGIRLLTADEAVRLGVVNR
jgi:hypothetical protein